MEWGTAITYLGDTTLKEKDVRFGIKDADRKHHVCMLGRSGSGRGDLITHMALQDVDRAIPTVILDANGNAAPKLVERLGKEVLDRLVYINPADAEHPYSWNIVEDVRHLEENIQETTLARIIRSVYQIDEEPFTEVLAPIILKRNTGTLVTFYLLLTNEKYREKFFEGNKKEKEILESLINEHDEVIQDIEEVGRYIAKDTFIRNLLGQHTSKFSFSSISKTGGIVVVDLSQIKMFPTRMTPLVRLFVEGAHIAGMENPQKIPTSLYLHDCLRYLSENEIEWVFNTETLTVTVADTVIKEEDKERRERALSQCGSVISFSPHPLDVQLVDRAFYPYVDPNELMHLEDKEMVAALTIDSVRARPFFARVSELGEPRTYSIQDIILESRDAYTTQRTKVDAAYKAERDIDRDDDGPPGGFQSAFKSIFAKRAAGGTPPPKMEPPAKKVEPKKEKGEVKKEGKKEISESVLKQMVYVQPITS